MRMVHYYARPLVTADSTPLCGLEDASAVDVTFFGSNHANICEACTLLAVTDESFRITYEMYSEWKSANWQQLVEEEQLAVKEYEHRQEERMSALWRKWQQR